MCFNYFYFKCFLFDVSVPKYLSCVHGKVSRIKDAFAGQLSPNHNYNEKK